MFKRILFPVDLADEGSWVKAAPVAASMAKTHQAELYVLNVVPDFGMSIVSNYFPQDFETKAVNHAEQALETFCDRHIPKDLASHAIVELGRVYDNILKVARDRQIDLIVMASHHPELADYLIGPNTARVVRHGHCSVLVVRN